MTVARAKKPIDDWQGEPIRPGEARNVKLAVGESYSGTTVRIPIHIRRATNDGPVVFVTAALHGDEINGAGAIRQLIHDTTLELKRGAIILVPVLNVLAFDRHSRYLPDRRDLNRSFPGSASGSLASRMARRIFDEIVARSDYGIDLHTAAVRRTNYPNIRADLGNPQASELAEAFGTEIILHGKGPKGSFRQEACRAGCPTIVMEGGEVWKVEPGIVASSIRGVRNILVKLDMIDGKLTGPRNRLAIKSSKWIRAERGGFLQFHVSPGDILEKDQPLATNTTLLGKEQSVLCAPFDAVVIGMSTIPAVSPGEPVCNLGRLPRGCKPEQLRTNRTEEAGLEERVTEDLASSLLVVDPTE